MRIGGGIKLRLDLTVGLDVEDKPELVHPSMGDVKIAPTEVLVHYQRRTTPVRAEYRCTVTVKGRWRTLLGMSLAVAEVEWSPYDGVEMPKWVQGFVLSQKPEWFTQPLKPMFTLEGEPLHPTEDEIFEEEL